MEFVLQLAAAAALIALMLGLRIASGRALFHFRMNHGFRAHECDGSCSHHKDDAETGTRRNE